MNEVGTHNILPALADLAKPIEELNLDSHGF